MTKGVEILGLGNTKDIYGLIMLADYTITSPELKRNTISVPGMNGTLDLSFTVNGRPVFGNGKVEFSLFVQVSDDRLAQIKSELTSLYHGRTVQIIFPFDPRHYYEGIIEFLEMSQYNSGRIPIRLTAYPYKFTKSSSMGDWMWDDFIFETDIARDYTALPVDGEQSYIIYGSTMPVSPIFTVLDSNGEGVTLYYGGKTYFLPEGRSTISDLWLSSGQNMLTFAGTGNIWIDFRGGEMY